MIRFKLLMTIYSSQASDEGFIRLTLLMKDSFVSSSATES
jgi:hypothetical protein